MSAFRDLAKQRPKEEDDGYAKLLCTEPGCGRRWSVKIDKPLCSFHAWGPSDGRIFVDMAQYATRNSGGSDGKQWARRILQAHESGQFVRPGTLKMAQDALGSRMKGVT